MHGGGDVLVVLAHQHVAQHLALALGQAVALAVQEQVVVDELLLPAALVHGRPLEAQRQHAEGIAAGEERAAQHKHVLGEVALGRIGARPEQDGVGQQEHAGVLRNDHQAQHPQQHVEQAVAAQAVAPGLVLRHEEAEPGEQQHPEQVQLAREVEQEAAQIALGQQRQHGHARRHEQHGRRHLEHTALLAQVIAYQKPERREEPAARHHEHQRHDHRVRRAQPRVGAGEEVVLEHPRHVEEVEQEASEGVPHGALARYQVGGKACSRCHDRTQQHEERVVEEHESHEGAPLSSLAHGRLQHDP